LPKYRIEKAGFRLTSIGCRYLLLKPGSAPTSLKLSWLSRFTALIAFADWCEEIAKQFLPLFLIVCMTGGNLFD